MFARKPICEGELLSLWGGKIIYVDEIDHTMENFTQLILQIEDGFYLMTPSMEPSDCFNHSCDPNTGLSGRSDRLDARH